MMKRNRSLLIVQVILCFLMVVGCSTTNKNNDEVFRILHNKEIVKNDSAASGLAKFQIKRGNNIVFTYNKIISDLKKDTVINKSESIVFQAPANVNRFDYKGASIDSSHAFYMTSAPNLVQYPISNGEINGHKLNDQKWQVDLSVTINVGGTVISRHISHAFAVSPYGEDSLKSIDRKPQVGQ